MNGSAAPLPPPPSGKFPTIVADPPWPQSAGAGFFGRVHDPARGRNTDTHDATLRSRALPYPTMSLAAISALPVEEWAEADAHLYLWVTNRHVESGYEVARAWGFRPVTLLTWCKKPMGGGLGGAFGQASEHVLFARRGREIRQQREPTTWWQWKRPYDERGKPRHSAKPSEFFEVVERVSPAPRLELFARAPRRGWVVWGNEV